MLNIARKYVNLSMGTKQESFGRYSVNSNKKLDILSLNNLWINRDSAHEKLCLSEISIGREHTGLKGQEFTQAWLPIPMSIIKSLMSS